MKRIFLIIIFAMTVMVAFAQPTTYLLYGSEDISTIRKYLSDNIGYLNPIEGIYDVTYLQQYMGGNSLFGWRSWSGQEKNITAAIFKNNKGTLSCKLYFRNSVEQKEWGLMSKTLSISQIGSTNVYRISGFYAEKYSHFGNTGCVTFDFSSRFSIQDIGFNVSFLGGNGFHQVEGHLSFIKEYPIAGKDDVKKNTSEWSGTGFALKDGFAITNYHVIENAATIAIYGINGDFHSAHSAYVVASDKSNDIALLKIYDSHFGGFRDIPYSVKYSMAEVGEDVFTLGYPLTAAMGEETKYTTGVISSRTGFQGDVSSYQISVPIQPGNSGGPLFDSKGNLIGIVNAKISSAENVSYAIKSSYLKYLVESYASSDVIPSANTIASLSRTDQIKRLRNFVFIVKCSDKVTDQSATLNVRGTESDSKSYHESLPSSSGSITSSASKISISSQKPNRQIDDNGVTITDFINAKAKESQLSVTKIRIQDSQTIIDFECGGKKTDDDFINIERSAVIIVDGKTYPMRKVGGIKIAPEKTLFNSPNESLSFKLFFPPINKSAKTMDFIESSSSKWQIHDIKLQ